MALGTDKVSVMDIFPVKATAEEWSASAAIRQAVAYLGFDLRKVVMQFDKLAPENLAASTDVPIEITSIEGVKLKVFDKNHPTTDLIFLINTFLERGNNVEKVLVKCDATVGQYVRKKCAAYGIPVVARRAVMGSLCHDSHRHLHLTLPH